MRVSMNNDQRIWTRPASKFRKPTILHFFLLDFAQKITNYEQD
jgi:hypothetical protein